jgi:hypothetical protein
MIILKLLIICSDKLPDNSSRLVLVLKGQE